LAIINFYEDLVYSVTVYKVFSSLSQDCYTQSYTNPSFITFTAAFSIHAYTQFQSYVYTQPELLPQAVSSAIASHNTLAIQPQQ
jgi:hypothetical protein